MEAFHSSTEPRVKKLPETGSSIRVLVADEQRRVRRGLRELLDSYPDIETVSDVNSYSEALDLVAELDPDVVVLGCRTMSRDCILASREIKKRLPTTRTVILAVSAPREWWVRGSGADACLVKGCLPGELLDAIRGERE